MRWITHALAGLSDTVRMRSDTSRQFARIVLVLWAIFWVGFIIATLWTVPPFNLPLALGGSAGALVVLGGLAWLAFAHPRVAGPVLAVLGLALTAWYTDAAGPAQPLPTRLWVLGFFCLPPLIAGLSLAVSESARHARSDT